eukprot:s3988_g2.t2
MAKRHLQSKVGVFQNQGHPGFPVLVDMPTRRSMQGRRKGLSITSTTSRANSRTTPLYYHTSSIQDLQPFPFISERNLSMKYWLSVITWILLPLLAYSTQRRQIMRRDEEVNGNGLVLYSIQTSAKGLESVRAAVETWAADLRPGQLQVIGMDRPEEPGFDDGITWLKSSCEDSHEGGACKDFTALTAAFDKGADWVILLGSDNYAVARNIEAVLAERNSATPEVLGIKGCGECKAGGLCGGGGQIFSRAALQRMLSNGRESYMNESLAEAVSDGMWGDVSNCRVAFSHGVPVLDLPGLHGWHLEEAKLREAVRATNPLPLTFHYLKVDEIRKLHALMAEPGERHLITATDSTKDTLVKWYQQRKEYVLVESSRRQILLAQAGKVSSLLVNLAISALSGSQHHGFEVAVDFHPVGPGGISRTRRLRCWNLRRPGGDGS